MEKFCKKMESKETDLLLKCSEDEIIHIIKEALQELIRKKGELI